ncbi:MAG: hypothetical protein CVU55_05110 [Deltaproteobacteria bacterium HGW-Deltaproteobacteria-13]|jgi:hypothetical protein|nr:MAG: hypothetical protein CVU55_05110 [Deltaproteobacteria bacterium HGW-Deltaproteobacteria-13]
MQTKVLSGLFIGFSLALIILHGQQVQATLGESVDSVAVNQKVLPVLRSSVKTSSNYTVHEFQSEAATIREYVSPSGIVFGIAWTGMTQPDLTPLLGTYAAEHKKALSHVKRQPGRRYLKIKSDNVVVEKWGHMRKMQGRAYAPALMPQGVSIDEIK